MDRNNYFFEVRGPYKQDLYMNFTYIPGFIGDSEIVTAWLAIDVRDNSELLNAINEVINEKKKEELLWGNAYKVYVKPNFSEIHCCFEDQLTDMKSCNLPTNTLLEIVSIWLNEYKRFREKTSF